MSRPSIPGFSVGRLLGRGAFASVWLAVDKKTGERFACKAIPKESLEKNTQFKNIKQEIDVLKKLQNSYIITMHNFIETETEYCVLMEICEGGTLEEAIIKKKKFTEPMAKEVFYQILTALAYCHDNNIAHRDLKPSNILIRSFPNVCVSDFGVSGTLSGNGLMSTICGTILYSAPECFTGTYNGPLADSWSSGVVLYTMLTGDVPFKARNTKDLLELMEKGVKPIHGVSKDCNNLLQRLITPDLSIRITARQALHHPWLIGSVGPETTRLRSEPRKNAAASLSSLRRPGIVDRKPKRHLAMSFELS